MPISALASPLSRRPAGFLIGGFVNGLGDTSGNMPSIVNPQALLEKLMQWNQLVQAREIPVEPLPWRWTWAAWVG